MVDDRTIEAPFSGHVGLTDVDPGERIQTSTAVTSLDNRSALLVRFVVPELLVSELAVGDQVAVSTWNSRRPKAFGEVVDIDSRVDPATRTFVAQARVDNEADALRPGQSFRIALEVLGDSYPVLPEVAVQWGADGAYVWTVRDDRAHRVPVEIIQRQGGQVSLAADLNENDLIVVEGIQRMRPGIEVEPELAAPAGDVGAAVQKSDGEGSG